MKAISNDLKSHLSGEVTTVATCWKLTRRDGVISGYTDHDFDLTIDSLEYKARTGFTPSAVQSSASFAVDNLDVEGMLDSTSITEEDIITGVYDYAEVEVFIVNYKDLTQGKLIIRTGWLGQISYSKTHFIAEIRGLAQILSQKIGDVFSPTCRALFGDEKCKKNVEDYTHEGVITNVTDRRAFSDTNLVMPTEYYNYGKVKFITGSNAGFEREVKDYILGENINLVLPMPYDIEVGDQFQITAGCDKNFKTCMSKFENAVNFRGEPHIPGMDKILETSATRSK